MCGSWPTYAQILQGKWVDASQAAIEQHRKTDITVIILDQKDRAVQGAKVELVQKRHDFPVGLKLPSDRTPPQAAAQTPVFRCFNAIAMDRYTDWSTSQAEDRSTRAQRLSAWQLALKPIHSHYGRIMSADPARNPDHLALLKPTELRDAILKRIDDAAAHPLRPDGYDLFADLLQQDIIERKLGQGMLYRMVERTQAANPKASFGLRARDVLVRHRSRDLFKLLQKLLIRQVKLKHLTIEQPLNGPIQPNALKRSFESSIAPLGLPVSMILDVGGPTPIAAAINLETVLRIAFAEPAISGIYFSGLIDDDMLEDNAGLIDAVGKPTAAGEVMDHLFMRYWQSNESMKTDERGNAKARVFTGWYDITASLPGGTQIKSTAYIPKSDRSKMIVLQTTAAEAE